MQAALNQLVVIPLSQPALLELTGFDVSISSCYDPNEELRLRHVIDAIGTKLFESKIRQLGQLILDRELTKSRGFLVDAILNDTVNDTVNDDTVGNGGTSGVDSRTLDSSDRISEGSIIEI